jgi:predicted Zn-dependent peptidase
MLEAYTSFEMTVYYAKVTNPYFERAVTVLADMLLAPRFDPHDIEKERRVISEELRQTDDTPSELIYTLLDTMMWGDQPLGRDIAGDLASVAQLTRADLMAFWRSHYTAANMVISVAGNITSDLALELISAAFAALPSGQAMPSLPSLPMRPGPALELISDDSEQGNFCLGFPGVAQFDPARRAMHVFDTVLGGGMSSRLVQEIREERGLAYNIGSFSQEYHDTGKWVVFGSVEPERLPECLETIMNELRLVLTHGISADELQRVKEQVKGGMLLSLEDTWAVASRNGSHLMRYGRVIPVEQVISEVEAITCADLQALAEQVLRRDAMHLAVIGPYDSIAELEGDLVLEEER